MCVIRIRRHIKLIDDLKFELLCMFFWASRSESHAYRWLFVYIQYILKQQQPHNTAMINVFLTNTPGKKRRLSVMYVSALACELVFSSFLDCENFTTHTRIEKRKWSDQPHRKKRKKHNRLKDEEKKKRFRKMKLRVCDRCERGRLPVPMKTKKMLIFIFTVMGCLVDVVVVAFVFVIFLISFILSMIRFYRQLSFVPQQHTCSMQQFQRAESRSRAADKHTNVHIHRNLRSKCINVFQTDYSYWLYD